MLLCVCQVRAFELLGPFGGVWCAGLDGWECAGVRFVLPFSLSGTLELWTEGARRAR